MSDASSSSPIDLSLLKAHLLAMVALEEEEKTDSFEYRELAKSAANGKRGRYFDEVTESWQGLTGKKMLEAVEQIERCTFYWGGDDEYGEYDALWELAASFEIDLQGLLKDQDAAKDQKVTSDAKLGNPLEVDEAELFKYLNPANLKGMDGDASKMDPEAIRGSVSSLAQLLREKVKADDGLPSRHLLNADGTWSENLIADVANYFLFEESPKDWDAVSKAISNLYWMDRNGVEGRLEAPLAGKDDDYDIETDKAALEAAIDQLARLQVMTIPHRGELYFACIWGFEFTDTWGIDDTPFYFSGKLNANGLKGAEWNTGKDATMHHVVYLPENIARLKLLADESCGIRS